jgi:LacI family transcriptional regulator
VVTIRDVAQRAGVSTASVSRVLNGTDRVSPGVAARVQTAVAALGYQPSDVARSLKTAVTNILACVIPDISNPFFPEMVRGVEDVAREFGYATLLCNTDDDPDKEDEYLRVLARRRIDGLILIPSHDESPPIPLSYLIEHLTPVVLVDRGMDGFAGDRVMVDNRRGGQLAAEHVLDLGHRRIGIVNRAPDTSSARERQEGFATALADRDAYDVALVRYGDYAIGSGRTHAMDLLSRTPRPTAILAGNDLIGIGALQAAAELGLTVPGDVSIVGFDGIALSEFVAPPLTTVAQPTYQLGRLAASLLVRRRSGETSGVGVTYRLEPHLVVRGSTGPVR